MENNHTDHLNGLKKELLDFLFEKLKYKKEHGGYINSNYCSFIKNLQNQYKKDEEINFLTQIYNLTTMSQQQFDDNTKTFIRACITNYNNNNENNLLRQILDFFKENEYIIK